MPITNDEWPKDFGVNNVVESLFAKEPRYGKLSVIDIYVRIIRKIDETDVDLTSDPCFVLAVTEFFSVRCRSSEFIAKFCSLIRDVRNEYDFYNIFSVSTELAGISKNKYEISFASKILHLADKKHDFIIYDKNVRMCFGLGNVQPTPNSYKRLVKNFTDFKNELEAGNTDKIYGECRKFLMLFDEGLRNKRIVLSENKKIDFYLWKLGGYLINNHKK